MKKLLCLILSVLLVVGTAACSASGKSEDVLAVEAQIEDLGKIDFGSGAQLDEIAQALEALSQREQDRIENLDAYLEALEEYEALQKKTFSAMHYYAMETITGGSFTMEFEIDGVGKGTAQVQLDAQRKLLNLYTDAKINGERGTIAIYDGFMIVGTEESGYIAKDISMYLDVVFQYLTKMEDLEKLMDAVADLIVMGTQFVFKLEIGKYLDVAQLKLDMHSYLDVADSQKWLEKHYGLHVEHDEGKTQYSFRPDLYQALTDSAEIFRASFLQEKHFTKLNEKFVEFKETLDKVKIELDITVEDAYLTGIVANVEGFDVEIAFRDCGSTQVDEQQLEELLGSASIAE